MMCLSAPHSHQRAANLAKQARGFRAVWRSASVVQPVCQPLHRFDGRRVGQDRQQVHQHHGEGVRQDALRRPPGPPVAPLQSGGR